MTKNGSILADALGKAMDAEIDGYISEAEAQPHAFSGRFERRMDMLLNSGRSARPVRRILLIAAAFMLLLALVGFTSEKIRSSVAGFFIETFGDHVEYSDPGITKTSIEEEYCLVPVPEGFEESIEARENNYVLVKYRNNSNDIITLIQCSDDHILESINSENCEISELYLDGKTIMLYYDSDHYAQASWTDNGYYFSLVYSTPIEIDQFTQWIQAVKVK